MSYYERSYGEKYDRNATTKELAKRIRADIKNSIKSGELPEGLRVSVRTKYFSGGSSIDCRVTACPVPFLNVERIWHDTEHPNEFVPEYRLPRYTEAGRDILEKLTRIMAAYNHDGSDVMTDYFDVKFYGHADFDYELESGVRGKLLAHALA